MQTLERQLRQLSVMVPGQNDAQKNLVRQQLQMELNDRETLVRQLRSDMANIDKLEDGEEVVYAVLEGYVDLQLETGLKRK